MKSYNVTGLRERLEQVPDEELKAMLQAELEREEPDPDSVRLILRILEERLSDKAAEPSPRKEAAWNRYQERVESLRKKPARTWHWAVRAASVILVIGVLFAVVPQEAEAEGMLGILARWKNSIFEFFSPENPDTGGFEYEFQTDHPGLQQLYDAVVEQGITEPVVPMWIPEGYELAALTSKEWIKSGGIGASFTDGENWLIYEMAVPDDGSAGRYCVDDADPVIKEMQGVKHYVMQNNEMWTVAWVVNEEIECSIYADCQEDDLNKILRSIYTLEE